MEGGGGDYDWSILKISIIYLKYLPIQKFFFCFIFLLFWGGGGVLKNI